MSIASEIQRLSGIRSDIFDSITNKGVTVPESATFSSCPDLIDSIQTGGGGGNNALYNTGTVAIAEASAFCTGSASQVGIPATATGILTGTATRAHNSYNRGVLAWAFPVSAISAISATGTYELGVIPTATVNTTLTAVGGRQSYPDATTSLPTVGNSVPYGETPPLTFYWSAVKSLTAATGAYVLVGWAATGSFPQRTAVPALTAGQLSGTVTGIIVTGQTYPYPDRPLTETAELSANASAAEYITVKADSLPSIDISGIAYTGITGNGTRTNVTGTVAGSAVDYAKAACNTGLNGWENSYFPVADYPRTAYSFASGSKTYTTGINNYV